MKPDKRIKDVSMVYNCYYTIESEKYVGKNGYFTNKISDFADLSRAKYGTLTQIATNVHSENPYYDGDKNYEYFLPEEYVKVEKHFRPYTLSEFICIVRDVGDRVRYKHKDDPQILHTLITEIMEDTKYVTLGHTLVSTERLLNEFEYYKDGDWRPFGVEVE